MPKILDLRATDDPRDIVHRSVQALVEGHVVGVPTETVYGLAANALCESAVERLCEVKGRQANTPLAINCRASSPPSSFCVAQGKASWQGTPHGCFPA